MVKRQNLELDVGAKERSLYLGDQKKEELQGE